MNRTFTYSLLSVLAPCAGYAVLFPMGISTHGYLLLVAFNAVGFIFSVMALSRSNEKPTNTSFIMCVSILLGAIGMYANLIAVELILLKTVFHSPQLQ